ncbi:MAG TPA: O-antigen ligase family protein [Bauldia sp.]|nr:O-antigen ligase family protein [Bauldia sp.]
MPANAASVAFPAVRTAPLQPARPARRTAIADQIFRFLILLAAAALPLSVPLRFGLGITDFDRYLDILSLAFLLVRVVDFATHPPPRAGFVSIVLFFFLFGIVAASNLGAPLFNSTLFLLDGKILLFYACVWSFGNRRLDAAIDGGALSTIMLASYAAAVLVFFLYRGTSVRLALLDESNYMIVILFLLCILHFSYHPPAFNKRTIAVYALVVLCCLLARSRTGFVLLLGFVFLPLVANRRYAYVFACAVLSLLAVIAAGDDLVQLLARGQTDVTHIDRFVFLNELLAQWRGYSPWQLLFGNHVGTYLATQSYYMGYWVARQSAEQHIPYGLAPFNLHSAYLRIAADLGLALAAFFLIAVWRVLHRSIGLAATLVLFVSATSMSVFYLSALLPFVISLQLARNREPTVVRAAA